jgi:peptidoglycan glycosyltransferase
MPNVIGLGENQAKAALARAGLTSVVVDYQTRDRVPGLFDRYGPYVVLSSQPGAGNWVLPNTTIILGVRSPDESGGTNAASTPVPAAPTEAPPLPTQPPVQPTQPPPEAPQAATPTNAVLPVPEPALPGTIPDATRP